MSQKLIKMAELFDVDVDASLAATATTEEADNLEEVSVSKPVHRKFSEECNDLQMVLDKEPAQPKPITKKQVAAVVAPASIPAPEPSPVKVEQTPVIPSDDDDDTSEFQTSSDVLDQVDADIQRLSGGNTVKQLGKAKQTQVTSSTEEIDPNNPNPLGLVGSQLTIYTNIKKSFPQFNLSDGSVAFKDFYICKLDLLNKLLGRFKLLDFSSMCKEIRGVKTDHFLGADFLDPEIIAKKMDDAYRWRVRLNALLSDVYEQCFVWERFVEILRSKLWKDHDMRGAHKRDALVFEHLADMEQYVAEMNGFTEMAKNYDGILKAAADSLSRQVTCLQLNEEFGLNRKQSTNNNKNQKHKAEINNLDTIDTGTLINPDDAKNGIAASKIVYEHDDEISRLGN